MSQKIATVFGGTGFLARYIVPQLTKAGYRVRIASRHPSRARHLLTQGDVGQVQPVYAPVQNKTENLVIEWTGNQLLEATSVTGPFTPVAGAVPPNSSIPIEDGARFFIAE